VNDLKSRSWENSMYRSILVPLDGSAFGEQALPLALTIARRSGANLRLATVHVPVLPVYVNRVSLPDQINSDLLKRGRKYLDSVAGRVSAVTSMSVQTSLLEGAVVDALCQEATDAHADLIVMTTHGRGALARAWLGSVADNVVRHAEVPVLLVRPREEPVDLAGEALLGRVLIPLDGSPFAEQIIEPAVALAALMKAEVALVRVIKPMVIGPDDPWAVPIPEGERPVLESLPALHEEDRRKAQAYLDAAADRLRQRSLQVQTRVVVHDHAAAAILDDAKANGVDLIALETHGYKGIARLLVGSVADKVLRGASLPVLIQRPTEKHG
jgi:nucleotide-binding universal stress UspA family protein